LETVLGTDTMNDGWRKEARDWGKTLLYTGLLSLVLRVAIVEAFVVPTGSMRPTILEGDRLLGSKFHYWFWQPARGDIVVFRPPENAQEAERRASRYVKRVIAVAGDTVEVKGGRVWVNGDPIAEPYLGAPPSYRVPPVVVPQGQLYVLGDNRNESFDSHRWGFLAEEALVAHVFARYWPPSRIGSF
jgi:signal peptidase I